MSRTEAELTPEEIIAVSELNNTSNNTVFYKDNSGTITGVALGANGTVLTSSGSTSAPTFSAGGGSGDVVGPTSSTDNAIARFNSTTGKLLQNSSASIDDLGNLTATNYRKILTNADCNTTTVAGSYGMIGTPTNGPIAGEFALQVYNDGTRIMQIATMSTGPRYTRVFSGTWGAWTTTATGNNTGDNATNTQYSGLAASKADVGQTFYIGTTQVAINRASAALTLAGLTLTTPDIGAATGTTLALSGASSLTLGTASSLAGAIIFKNGTNANTLTLQSGVTGATIAYTLPATAPTDGQVLSSLADGTMSWIAAGGAGLAWGASISAGSGVGLTMTSADLSGANAFQSSIHTASGTLTACTTTQNTYATSRTYTLTSGSITDNFIGTLFSRTNITTGAGGTLLAQGPVVNITGTDTQTAGTLTPTYDLLKLQPSLLNKGGAINITVANSTVAATNGLFYAVLGNTQAVAHTVQKIDLGTSAQGHTGLLIKSYNASSTCRAIQIDASTTSTGIGLSFFNVGGSSYTRISFEQDISTTGVSFGLKYANINSGTGTGYGIYQGTIQASNTGIGYGIHQAIIGSGTGTGYGIYQEIISAGTGTYFGWKVNDLQHPASATNNTGKFFSLNNAQSMTLTARTTDTSEILHSKIHTGTTTVTDNFNILNITRTNAINNVSGTFNVQGSVLKLENVATQTAGTLTDTVSILTLAQGVTTTGNLIIGTKAGSAVFTVTSTGAIITGGLGTGVLGGTGLTGRIVGDIDTGATTSVDFALRRSENTTATLGNKIYWGRQRGTLASPLVITTGDAMYDHYGYAYDGTDYTISTAISSFCEGTIASNQVPGVLTFSTASSAGALTERLRLDSAGLATFSGAIKTDIPNGGTAGAWKTGILVTTASVFDTTRYIQLDVGGTLYKLAVCT